MAKLIYKSQKDASLLLFILSTALLGLFITLVTKANLSWYERLVHTGFTITPMSFGWGWTFVIVLSAIAAALVLQDFKDVVDIGPFLVNGAMALAWVIVFFGFKELFIAFIVSLMLLVSVTAMILTARKTSEIAAWLLMPYLIWSGWIMIMNAALLVALR